MVNKTNDMDHSHGWELYAGQAFRLNREGLKPDKTSKNHRTVLQALLELDYNTANQGQRWKI